MIGAILFVHFKGGFFLPAGYEYALTLLGSSIALVLTGAGQFSMDGLLAGRTKTSVEAAAPERAATRRAA